MLPPVSSVPELTLEELDELSHLELEALAAEQAALSEAINDLESGISEARRRRRLADEIAAVRSPGETRTLAQLLKGYPEIPGSLPLERIAFFTPRRRIARFERVGMGRIGPGRSGVGSERGIRIYGGEYLYDENTFESMLDNWRSGWGFFVTHERPYLASRKAAQLPTFSPEDSDSKRRQFLQLEQILISLPQLARAVAVHLQTKTPS